MCGIAGIFDMEGTRAVNPAVLERMTRSLLHRGPDGEGYHYEPGVGLGHRRLAIIDLRAGQQPMFNEDGAVSVTYNGEIYNFERLQRELERKGHRFRTRCDTEVIVHAWEEWGESCVDRFNGMFAFAIWDRRQSKVFLARDRIGIKPLYYSITSDGFCLFASELKAILEHPMAKRELRPDSVEDYFTFGYVPDPKTILRDAWKLPPGHTITFTRGESLPTPRKYWDIPFERETVTNLGAVRSELIDRLHASVKRRMIADVPLGAFLSGGVDSSAVVALMSESADSPVNTSSICFGDPAYNEAQFAQMVAKKYNTKHTVRQVDSEDFSLIRVLPGLYDEPFADSSALPTYRVCELARQKVTVALSGDGGDENFVGYRRYRWHAYEELVRRGISQRIRGPVFGLLGSVYPKADWAPKVLRAKSTFQALARDTLEGYMHSVSICPSSMRNRMFSRTFKRDLQDYSAIEVFRQHAQNAPVQEGLKLIQYLDFKTYLSGDILTKVDRASMAHSLEVRVPLLDHEFVEWAAGIPTDLMLKGREGKLCFKQSLEPYLPPDILYRSKMGFRVPISSWFRNELRELVRNRLLGSELLDVGIFDGDVINDLVSRHQSGRSEHSSVLWALLMFEGSLTNILKGGANKPIDEISDAAIA